MNWLFIILIFILLLNMFSGIRKGLWHTMITFFVLLFFLVVMNLIPPNFVLQLHVTDEVILNSKLSQAKDFSYVIGLLPDKMEEKLLHGYSSYNEVLEADKELAHEISANISIYSVVIIMVVAVVLILFVFPKVGALRETVLKISFLNKFDKLLGMAVGFVNGIFIIHMIFIGIAMFSATEFGGVLFGLVGESEFLMNLYKNNFLIKIFF